MINLDYAYQQKVKSNTSCDLSLEVCDIYTYYINAEGIVYSHPDYVSVPLFGLIKSCKILGLCSKTVILISIIVML